VSVLSPHDLEKRLRAIGAERYHRNHPFHHLLHGGQCSRLQVQAWALNRYYYQRMIPVKDAALIANCDDPAVRREWRHRLEDHDGDDVEPGGTDKWLQLMATTCARSAASCRRRASRSRPMSTSSARSRRSMPSPRR
jgi:pyrroloquinoline-quinone synthase